MSEDRIDFSSLDSMRDPARFDRMVGHVLAGANLTAAPLAVKPRAPDFLVGLQSWGGKALAIAALLAALVWVPHMSSSGSYFSTASNESRSDAVELVSTWAQSGEVPSDVDLDRTLGVTHVN